jgi:hypothetical protein
MKTFLIKAGVFAILLMGGTSALEFMADQGHRKDTESSDPNLQTWNDIFNSKIDSDVIILGNSRAYVHISPMIIDSVLHVNSYNFGEDTYPFHVQYIRYQVFEKYNQKPKLIIQCADFTTFWPRITDKLPFLHYSNEPLFERLPQKMNFSKPDLYMPMFKYHGEYVLLYLGLSSFFKEETLIHERPIHRYKGYIGHDKKWNESTTPIRIDDLRYDVDPKDTQLFDSFLNYCKENDIRIVLVFTPQYFQLTESAKKQNNVMDIFHSFSEKYDIPFLDYSTDSLCYDTAYFYNSTHLNKTGAELFSLKLANDIKAQNLYNAHED